MKDQVLKKQKNRSFIRKVLCMYFSPKEKKKKLLGQNNGDKTTIKLTSDKQIWHITNTPFSLTAH